MRVRAPLAIVVIGVALLLASEPGWAHHNLIVQFALNKPITLRGTLTKMEWVNPHGWIYLDVKGADGQVENWAIETGSPLQMTKRGLTRTDFRFGIELIVGGWAARDGTRTAAGWIVSFPDREASGREASFALGR